MTPASHGGATVPSLRRIVVATTSRPPGSGSLVSKLPGHPEYRCTAGVECATDPLGTGIATSGGGFVVTAMTGQPR
jgi:hypothetical protein